MVLRSWLVALMRGEGPPAGPPGDLPPQACLQAAQVEGVVALVHSRLQDRAIASLATPELQDLFAAAARERAARSLLLQAETRRVLKCFEAGSIPVLVIKGSALAHWLYSTPHLRECEDVDLLFPSREDVQRAAELLRPEGYDWLGPAGDLARCEATCTRVPEAGPSLELDLHWDIGGSPVYERRFSFQELAEEALLLPSLAEGARGLGPVHALVHAALHRALQLWMGTGDRLKWLFDFHEMARRFTEAEWDELLSLAREKGLCGTCLHALRASERTFGTPLPLEVLEGLQRRAPEEGLDLARMDRWGYLQRMNFRALPGPRLKLRWLRQRLLPPGAYLRHHFGGAGGTPAALLRYLGTGLRNLGK
ncbi:MAG: nucleotidyltransferase family protein [Acidobacteria bacterium]|nr:nucleotidyltransferase family protein [Acidobacteriota bacterium]